MSREKAETMVTVPSYTFPSGSVPFCFWTDKVISGECSDPVGRTIDSVPFALIDFIKKSALKKSIQGGAFHGKKM